MLRYLTAGESHGKTVVAILEGMPAGLSIDIEKINHELARRQMGYGRGGRMKIEQDRVEVESGIRGGKTLGSPIALRIPNRDWENWKGIMDVAQDDAGQKRVVHEPRPGHADLAGGLKYNHADLRNILERASARETAARVAVGAITRQFLDFFKVKIGSHVVRIGPVSFEGDPPSLSEVIQRAEKSPVRCIDPKTTQKMIDQIDRAKKQGDSLGGIFEIIAEGIPIGLGSHVQWDRRLDGQLAQALMSIQAMKGVEIGMGFDSTNRFGSEVHDEIFYSKKRGFFRKRNNAGGLEGGITNGEPIVLRVAMKPLSTLYRPLQSVNTQTKKPFKATVERTDTTAVPAAAVIGENVAAFTIANAFLEKFGGDSMGEITRNYQGYLKQIADY